MQKCTLMVLFSLVLILGGCVATSPYVGTWVNPYAVGSSTITLRADGTGCAYGFVFSSSEENFQWHEENGRAIISGNTAWPQDDFYRPRLTPDGKALMYGGDAYYKQKE